MQTKPARLGKVSDRFQFARAVGSAIFRCLRDRDGVWLHLMHIVADRIDQSGDPLRRQLCAFARTQHQFGAVEIEAGRAALVHFDMRFLMAHDPAMRLAHGRKREAICRGARCCPDSRALAAEQIAEALIKPRRQGITVIRIVSAVRCPHGFPNLGVDWRGIVREEGFRLGHGSPASSRHDRKCKQERTWASTTKA